MSKSYNLRETGKRLTNRRIKRQKLDRIQKKRKIGQKLLIQQRRISYMYAMIFYGTEVIPHNPDRPAIVDINAPMFYGYETAVFDDTLSKEDINKIVEGQKKDEIFNEIVPDESAVIYRGNYCILKHWINWKEITKEEYKANDYIKID